jgi:hypothetical protein
MLCTYQPFCHSLTSTVSAKFRHSSGKSTPIDSAELPRYRLFRSDVSSPAYSKYTASGTVLGSKNRDVNEAT